MDVLGELNKIIYNLYMISSKGEISQFSFLF